MSDYTELLRLSKKAADAWRNDSAYYQEVVLIDSLCAAIDELTEERNALYKKANDTFLRYRYTECEECIYSGLKEDENPCIDCINTEGYCGWQWRGIGGNNSYGPLHKKLGEWISAEKDGKLVVMPFSIGDTVYLIANRKKYLQKNLHTLYIKEVKIRLDNLHKYMDKVGKTVFLTREDAEAALTGRKEVQG